VEETTVLVLGDHGTVLSDLSDRIRRHGYRAVRAKTPHDAIDIAAERGFRFAVGLIESGLAALDLRPALDLLRNRAGAPDMLMIAMGEMPDTAERARLRAAGIQQALWEPVGDHALLFHLNRATSSCGAHLRAAQRVPTEWQTRVMVAGRAKQAFVYSLSTGGAFLATERPSMRGAELAVELPLPSGRVSLLGRVLYTNVPGNLKRDHLPTGMGIAFVRTPPDQAAALEAEVGGMAARFFV
jgi:CheY-like chemotaxis protein